jgi:hypothetical protein
MKTQKQIEDCLADALAEFLIYFLDPVHGHERCEKLREQETENKERNDNRGPIRRKVSPK